MHKIFKLSICALLIFLVFKVEKKYTNKKIKIMLVCIKSTANMNLEKDACDMCWFLWWEELRELGELGELGEYEELGALLLFLPV